MNAILDLALVCGLGICIAGAALVSLAAVLMVVGAVVACAALVVAEARRE